jgi:hypothetical protein
MADCLPPTGATTNGNGAIAQFNDGPQIEHKRLILACIIIGLWVVLGILGVMFKTHFYDLSVYFLTLTGFAGSYIISETKRPAVSTTIFKKGTNSTREVTIYIVVLLWLALGVLCIVKALDLLEASAYFGVLSPYVMTYLIGAAYKPDLPMSTRQMMYNNNIPNYTNSGGFWGTYHQPVTGTSNNTTATGDVNTAANQTQPAKPAVLSGDDT